MSDKKELVYFPTWTAGRKGYAQHIREMFQEYLQSKNLHMTPQRLAILNHLLEANQHLGLEEIHAALKSRGIGRVTVFRMLKTLEECRLVERIMDFNGRPRFEVKMERPHHDHLICLSCGAIMEVRWPGVEKIQDQTCRKLGFKIVFHRHELFGHCKECQVGQN